MADELAGTYFYSYQLQTETKINIDELIYVLTPGDMPLVYGIGSDGVPLLRTVPVDNTTFYWLEEEVPQPRGLIAEALDGSETDVTVATGHAVKFAVGMAVRVDGEVMHVTAIDTTTEVLTVVRGSVGVTGTAVATHNSGAEIIGIGTALPEGDVGGSTFQGRDRFSNKTQIFSAKWGASRTAQRIPKYGVPNELNKQGMANMHALMLSIEQSALFGIPVEVAATGLRQTGGFDHFVTTNVDTTSEWLTSEVIAEQLQSGYNQGGTFDYIMARPEMFAALNAMSDSTRITTVDVNDSRRGRQRATSVLTDMGEVQLVRNRWMKRSIAADGNAFAFSKENFVKRLFHPLTTERLAKSDDRDTYMMVTELGWEVKGQDHMAKWTGLNTAAPMPAVV